MTLKGPHESRSLLRFRFPLCVARAARARAQGAAVRTEGAFVFGRRHAKARVRRAQSAPSRADARRRRFRRSTSRTRSSNIWTKPIPRHGAPLFPGDVRTRALVRRLISEVDDYFDKAIDPLTTQAFCEEARGARSEGDRRRAPGGRRRDRAVHALLRGDFLAGPLSAADFAFYPLVAFVKRCEMKLPDLDADGMLTPELRAWKARIEAAAVLREDDSAALEGELMILHRRRRSRTMASIPAEFAFGAIDPRRTSSCPPTAIPISPGAGCRRARSRWRSSATTRTCRRAATTSTRRDASCRRRCRASTSSTGC